jgi:hypothetical protein
LIDDESVAGSPTKKSNFICKTNSEFFSNNIEEVGETDSSIIESSDLESEIADNDLKMTVDTNYPTKKLVKKLQKLSSFRFIAPCILNYLASQCNVENHHFHTDITPSLCKGPLDFIYVVKG